MPPTSHLHQFIADNLHDLIGYTADIIAEYIYTTVVQQCRSVDDVKRVVAEQTGVNDGDQKLHVFAVRLYSLLQQHRATLKPAQPADTTSQTKALLRRNKQYKLVDSGVGDGGDGADMLDAANEAERTRRKAERKQLRKAEKLLRAADSANMQQQDDSQLHDDNGDRKQLTADEQADSDRLKDIRERDEFAARMLEKRNGSKQNSDTQSDNKQQAVSDEMIPELRRLARIDYLNRRELQQIEQLRRTLQRETELLPDTQLTQSELKDRQHKRRLLKLVDERRRGVDEVQTVNQYIMPSATDHSVDDTKLKPERYSKRSKHHHDDGSEFEAQQSKAAQYSVGAKSTADDKAEYDYVFDTSIDFVRSELISGTVDKIPQSAAQQAKVAQQSKFDAIQDERRRLPIYPYKQELLNAIATYQTLIIVGETGSGKTTQVMQYLYEAGYCADGKMLGCTQPRRVAAMSVAARVSDEIGTKCGQLVGYTIRFEDNTSELTRVKYMTDGMLLREFLTSPDLAKYSVMMIDEAHERTLHTDILFGLIKDVAKYRPDIKVLISSATLDAQKFSTYFDDAPIFVIPGRRYPVDIYYTKQPEADYIDAVIVTCLQIHTTQPVNGDILVFLTGQDEIEQCEELLQQRIKQLGNKIKEMIICPIYSTLPTDMQARIFEPAPPDARKVILATNIAETSLTINGIVYVIDPGFVKQKSFNPRTGMESLVVVPISRASANQRAGRAGRVSSGRCFRLYTAHAYATELTDNTVPEIQRTNLCAIVLQLKSLGIDDLIHFDFMDPPPADTLIRALEQLYALGALNELGELTKLGRRMAELPLDPMLSRTLIASAQYRCTNSIITICSMLSLSNTIFYTPKNKRVEADASHRLFASPAGDQLTLLNTYNAWRDAEYSVEWCYEHFIQFRSLKKARDVRDQLIGMCERIEIEYDDTAVEMIDEISICKAVLCGFFVNTVKLDVSGKYKTLSHGRIAVQVYPGSVLSRRQDNDGPPAEYLCYHELIETKKVFIRNCVQTQGEWFQECAPQFGVVVESKPDRKSNKHKAKT